jgi:hypothetical protein
MMRCCCCRSEKRGEEEERRGEGRKREEMGRWGGVIQLRVDGANDAGMRSAACLLRVPAHFSVTSIICSTN